MHKTSLVIYLLYSSSSLALIYDWTSPNGVQQYTQSPPRDSSISSEKIYIKKHISDSELPSESIQQSADAIAKSNAERKATSDKFTQQIKQLELMRANCLRAKKSLSALELGGNRMYKDAEGNYLRLNEEAKAKQREEIKKQIKENCL